MLFKQCTSETNANKDKLSINSARDSKKEWARGTSRKIERERTKYLHIMGPTYYESESGG